MPTSDYYTTVSDKNDDEIEGLLETAALLGATESPSYIQWRI